MPTIRNVNPIGEVDVPLLRRIVGRGEAVDVTDAQAEHLLLQVGNWQPVETPVEAAPAADTTEGVTA